MATESVRSADGTRIAYEIAETGPRGLVFVHGSGGDRRSHGALKTLLSVEHRLLSYDRRGRGDSEDADAYDLMREVDDLRAVLQACGERPVVLGISLGARIAFELLREPPELTKLILFEPPITDRADPAYSDKLARIAEQIANDDPEAATALNYKLLHQRTDAEIDALRATPDWPTRVRHAPITLREMLAVHDQHLFEASRYVAPSYPVHLLVGSETLPFISKGARLIAALPFVTAHTLQGHNHSAPRDKPDAVMGVISSLGL